MRNRFRKYRTGRITVSSVKADVCGEGPRASVGAVMASLAGICGLNAHVCATGFPHAASANYLTENHCDDYPDCRRDLLFDRKPQAKAFAYGLRARSKRLPPDACAFGYRSNGIHGSGGHASLQDGLQLEVIEPRPVFVALADQAALPCQTPGGRMVQGNRLHQNRLAHCRPFL